MNAEDPSLRPLELPELADVRQEQLDWCIDRVARLELGFDCLAKRLPAIEIETTNRKLNRKKLYPVAEFESQLIGVSDADRSLWSEYWDEAVHSALQQINDLVVTHAQAIVGMHLPLETVQAKIHRFELTGTPLDKPVSLCIFATPSLAFKPEVKTEAALRAIHVTPILEIGRATLAPEILLQMQLGGLIVLRKELIDSEHLTATMFLRSTERSTLLSAVNWNLNEGIISVTEKNITSASDDSLRGDAIVIPICAQIELQSIDIDRLKGLRAEDILQTGFFPKDVIVKLVAGGVALGEGLLLQLDGKLAVRITKLNHRSG